MESIRRYPPQVEAAVYFCCLESLQNTAKHAGGDARSAIRVWEEAGELRFEVVDSGFGFDAGAFVPGAGLLNMKDRLGAVRGSLMVDATPGAGTRVAGAVPVA